MKDKELSDQAVESNIEYYRKLYEHHAHMAREYNRELGYWIWIKNSRSTPPTTT
jgi:hypothetical protein